MNYAITAATGVLCLVVGYLLSQKVESRKNQREVATKLVDLLDAQWAWLHQGIDVNLDTVGRMREFTVWIPRLAKRKLRARITAALSQGTVVYTGKAKREVGEQAEMEAMLWQDLTEIKNALGRYYH